MMTCVFVVCLVNHRGLSGVRYKPMRALVVIRLSRVTDATTSPERQLESCQQLCAQRGWDVVGVAEDLDVSGAVDPFDRKRRPNLARWLAFEEQPFDVIVAYRVDRLTRSIRHLQQLVHWAEDHKKLVVSATEAHFDTTSPFAAVVIALMGTVAQMELEAIKERNRSAAHFNIRAGKYRGSLPPWGYMPTRVEGEWRLVPDPVQRERILEVYHRVVDNHEPLHLVAHDLNRRGVLSPKDYFAKLQGREPQGREWSATALKRSLISEAMLGYATLNGKTVRDDDGAPLVRSEPILTREQLESLRAELVKADRAKPAVSTPSLLLRVLFCAVCGEPAYKFTGGGRKNARYRCRSWGWAQRCGNGTVAMAEWDAFCEEQVLDLLGDSERLEKVWVAGSDSAVELAEVNAELVDLTSLIGSPAYRVGSPQREALDARIAALAARQEELEGLEARPSGWEWRETGQRFGDWWRDQDTAAKNTWLRSMNVRLTFDVRGGLTRTIDFGDLQEYEQHLRLGSVVERLHAGMS
ncbi:integrase [Mycobacterium phage Tasp14]|uniref:integrase n=2 Tax=unclassified Fromanvirus TaxID=2562661 RepID=UPI0006BDB335|nr:integrase [Mycobacterium phage Tasp14]ALA11928.1 integrase [Mycobacterium phage Tasp14]